MLCCIDIIIGILIIVYVICINIISSTTITFSIPLIVIGFLFILYHFIKEYSGSKKYLVIIKKCLVWLFFVCIFLFMLVESFIIGYPKINNENTDYIIILGTKLKDGHIITKTLRDRLDTAVKSIYSDGDNGYIIVSGGQVDDEEISETDAMERYLLDQGVPKSKIIKENKSNDTYDNLKNSKVIAEEHSGKSIQNLSIKIITTDYEALRSSLLARRLGYKDVKLNTSGTIFYLAPIYYIREAFTLINSLFFN